MFLYPEQSEGSAPSGEPAIQRFWHQGAHSAMGRGRPWERDSPEWRSLLAEAPEARQTLAQCVSTGTQYPKLPPAPEGRQTLERPRAPSTAPMPEFQTI
jgi:hypothetical protein